MPIGCDPGPLSADHEAQPRVNLRQVRLLPAKRGAQGQECGQQRHRQVYCPLASKQPQEVIDEDEVPIHLREKRIEDPEQKGCQASPVGLGTGHAHHSSPNEAICEAEVGFGDVRLEQHFVPGSGHSQPPGGGLTTPLSGPEAS